MEISQWVYIFLYKNKSIYYVYHDLYLPTHVSNRISNNQQYCMWCKKIVLQSFLPKIQFYLVLYKYIKQQLLHRITILQNMYIHYFLILNITTCNLQKYKVKYVIECTVFQFYGYRFQYNMLSRFLHYSFNIHFKM